MDHLSFENDDHALLAACAAALRPVRTGANGTAAHMVAASGGRMPSPWPLPDTPPDAHERRAEALDAPVYTAFPGGGAAQAEVFGAEALSREIERDARRYDRI